MHDIEIRPDSIVTSLDGPVAPSAPIGGSITAAINARTPLGLTTPGILGDSVDIINNLTAGALVRKLAGIPPGPQNRAFELGALPDSGGGSLALPPLQRVGSRGTLTFVNDAGAAAQGAAITGLSLTAGAYLKSIEPLPSSLDLRNGWSLFMSFRTASGVNNSSRNWLGLGRRNSDGTFGVQFSESVTGQMTATVQDPRYGLVTIRSNATARNTVVNVRLRWDSASQTAQWFVNGVASGAAVPLTFVPEVAAGALFIGTNIGESTSVTPTGSIHQVGFELTNAGVQDSYAVLPSVTTITAAEAAMLQVDALNLLRAVPDAGSISARYQAATGAEGRDLAVAIGGYANVVERLTRYISGDSFWSPVQLGSTRSSESALVLTPPTLGAIRTSSSIEYKDVGAFVGVSDDGTPRQSYLNFDSTGGGSNGNPAGGVTRGYTGLLRLQQRDEVREFTLVEMNNPAKLNGGGEAWGHADDQWVPIHSLWYGYEQSNFLYPTQPDETPTVTVTAVPGAGEGFVRVLRTGPNLRVGDAIAWGDVRRLGWSKIGVSAVSAGCRLGVRISAPGAPDGLEDYALKLTDAIRPAGLDQWFYATTNYCDQPTNSRWASRGGDWTGQDGLYGAQPYVASAPISAGQTLTVDVTEMVRTFGPDFFGLAASTAATISLTPPSFTTNPAIEPVLRVIGGARAGSYKATRWGLLGDSDGTTWKPSYSAPYTVRRVQPMLLAFDTAGRAGQFADATRIELVLNITSVSSGPSALQLFRPTPQPPRPGPRIVVSDPTPIRSRADFIVGIDRDADWLAMIDQVDERHEKGTNPNNYTIASGCYYGAIPLNALTGMSLFRGFWRSDRTGYPVIRMGRMMGWHINYQPMDSSTAHPGVSGKTAGVYATGKGSFEGGVDVGRGGLSVSGLGGYTTRGQRGRPSSGRHRSTSPLYPYLSIGDYTYSINGSSHGVANYGVAPIKRNVWLWIETVHATNSVQADGRWQRDGVFEMYVNGRKHVEYRGLEYRISGNPWLWDAIWFDEYNGGTNDFKADRPWPFVVGPTYVVAGTAPIAPPAGWNVPFVNASGQPEATPLPYVPAYL